MPMALILAGAIVIAVVAWLRSHPSYGSKRMSTECADQTQVEGEVYEKLYGQRSNGASQGRQVDSSPGRNQSTASRTVPPSGSHNRSTAFTSPDLTATPPKSGAAF